MRPSGTDCTVITTGVGDLQSLLAMDRCWSGVVEKDLRATEEPARHHTTAGCDTWRDRRFQLTAPRYRHWMRHPLVSVLLITCSAMPARARSFTAMGQWGESALQDALTDATSLSQIHVTPSATTLNTVCPAGSIRQRSTARAPTPRTPQPGQPPICLPR